MSEFTVKVGRRFARFATNVVMRRPRLWGALRPLIRVQFDNLAPRWDEMRSVARSSIKPTSWMSGTFEHPTP